jgi:small subunit ribosomal protein S17
MTDRPKRKTRVGVVVSDKRDRTVTVEVSSTVLHQRYKKTINTSKRFHAHDEANDAHMGDMVRLEETRPYSKTKRWRVAEIIERAQ